MRPFMFSLSHNTFPSKKPKPSPSQPLYARLNSSSLFPVSSKTAPPRRISSETSFPLNIQYQSSAFACLLAPAAFPGNRSISGCSQRLRELLCRAAADVWPASRPYPNHRLLTLSVIVLIECEDPLFIIRDNLFDVTYQSLSISHY